MRKPKNNNANMKINHINKETIQKAIENKTKQCKKEAKLIVEDASDDIARELEFEDSFNRSLDSILRLQDLGVIHRVETNLRALYF